MSVIRLNADSVSAIFNGYALSSLAEGDFITIESPNPLTVRTNAENDGVTVKQRLDARVLDVTIRVQKLSEDDIFLNVIRNSNEPILINGSIKESYTIDGNDSKDSWTLEAGSITDQPSDTKNNQDGNAMMEYKIQFRTGIRNL